MSSKLWNRLDAEARPLWAKWKIVNGMLPSSNDNTARVRHEIRLRLRQPLIEHYMPLAEMIATKKRCKSRQVDPADVLAEAYLALVGAVDAFQPGDIRKASFATFAGWRLRGATVEPERANDWVSHKVRAELGDSLPAMTRFPDERDGRTRCENTVPGRVEESDETAELLAREMRHWSPETREVVELLLECGWDVDEFVRRVYAPESTVSESLLQRCGNPRLAVKLVRRTLKEIGAETAISSFGVKVMPPVQCEEPQYGVAL